jgi:hypothetical protein
MNEPSELKRLAEALIAANDRFNECPQDNEVGDAWSFANDRFTEAASPEYILDLIAENDTLFATAQALRDEWRKCQADAGRYQFIADSACDVSFYVANTDSGDGDTTPGPRVELTPDQYPVEMFGTGKARLDFAVDALMATKEVETPFTENENVSRHDRR